MANGIHLIIGAPGQGKSSYLKNLYFKKRVFIYDVNNEHYKNENYKLPLPEDFVRKVENEQNCIIVFEEATIFFGNNSNTDTIRRMLVRKRHTGQYIVFVFHSIRTVPVQIMDFAEVITLFPTGDNEGLIFNKYKGNDLLMDAFRKVKSFGMSKINWTDLRTGAQFQISKYHTQKLR